MSMAWWLHSSKEDGKGLKMRAVVLHGWPCQLVAPKVHVLADCQASFVLQKVLHVLHRGHLTSQHSGLHAYRCALRGVFANATQLMLLNWRDFRGVYTEKEDFTASPSEQQLGTSQMLCSSTTPLLPVQEDHIFITSGFSEK